MGKGHQDKHSWWTWGRLAAILGALSAAGGRLGGGHASAASPGKSEPGPVMLLL